MLEEQTHPEEEMPESADIDDGTQNMEVLAPLEERQEQEWTSLPGMMLRRRTLGSRVTIKLVMRYAMIRSFQL